MSINQSRAEKSESSQYRKLGRSGSSGQPMNFSGDGGGGPTPPPPYSSSNRSFKKSNYVQGGQYGVSNVSVNSDINNTSTARAVQNGAPLQSPWQASDAPATGITIKSIDGSTQKSIQAVPKAPSSHPATLSSDTAAPLTPAKDPGDVSRSFPLQFGSISPGFMIGMQVPAQTSSAPPNLDEKKCDQARHDSFRAVPTLPIPSTSKQQLPKKNVGDVDQSNAGEAHSTPHAKRDVQVSSVTQPQKPSVHPFTGSSMQMPFHQPQVPMQFGVPNQQMHSQGITATSVPLTMQMMPLPIGNHQVPQQVFVPSLQSHTMQPQGITHQGQSLGFSSQMGTQLSPHMGNLGVSATPQFPRQRTGKIGVSCKAVKIKIKIFHPDSHEELRLDKRTDSYNVPPQLCSSTDSDRWQRGTGFHRGLIPSPQTPLQVMHKAENKYEVGRVTDEEEAKQRQLKAILNMLMPQNSERLFDQVKALNIDNAVTLTGVISQIFDKALMEPTFCEMYANIFYHLAGELPDFSEDNEKITCKRLLLNKCQMEFESREREQEEANRADEEGEVKQSEEERAEKRTQAQRRMLGNIRLIGELYKKKMLTERIMHECIKKLLGQYQNPNEEDIEALCILMSTIGEMIDHPKAKVHMDVYFDMMAKLSNNMILSSRLRFMLKDAIDLRKNRLQQRRKVEGPKKIEEVHRDAAQERQAQASWLARGPGIISSVRRDQPMDFSQRNPNMLSSPNTQMRSFRGSPTQLRGYGTQDARLEERQFFENRNFSVPLTHRPIGDEAITLGTQGGLARGMSFRGQPSVPNIPLADVPSPRDSRRMTTGWNGYSHVSEPTAYGPREDLTLRYIPGRLVSAAYDQSSMQEQSINYGNRDPRNADRSANRSLPTSPPTRGRGPILTQNDSSEKLLTEERLQDMSLSAIKEFYSARDEKEVALCIKDMNAPSFYPSMISIWVTDSFERKDLERDLLAKLLINLAKSQDILRQDQLIKGFEAVLTTLEDAVNDAPKAAEFLGRIFAKVILDNLIPFIEIAQLVYEGGEEQGRLVEIGLAAEVVGSILELINSEKGDSAVNEILTTSTLRLEKFRPPNLVKPLRLDKFV